VRGDVDQVDLPLAQVDVGELLEPGDQGAHHLLERPLGVDRLVPDHRLDLAEQRGVLEHQPVSVEDRGVLGADPLARLFRQLRQVARRALRRVAQPADLALDLGREQGHPDHRQRTVLDHHRVADGDPR
jgi:hypothetical protein